MISWMLPTIRSSLHVRVMDVLWKPPSLTDFSLHAEITEAILRQSPSYHHSERKHTSILNPKHNTDSKFQFHNCCKALNAGALNVYPGVLVNKGKRQFALIFLMMKGETISWVTLVLSCPSTAAAWTWPHSWPGVSKHFKRSTCDCTSLDRSRDTKMTSTHPMACPWSSTTLLSLKGFSASIFW